MQAVVKCIGAVSLAGVAIWVPSRYVERRESGMRKGDEAKLRTK